MSTKKKHNVEYADTYYRMFAWFIDISLILAAGWFLSEIILNVLKLNETRVIWLANNITDFVIGFLYFWLMETFTGGKTIGKYILKIRTVDQKSLEPTTPKRYALNNLTKSTLILILDVLFGLILREDPDKKQIRHTQLLSQTVVIKE